MSDRIIHAIALLNDARVLLEQEGREESEDITPILVALEGTLGEPVSHDDLVKVILNQLEAENGLHQVLNAADCYLRDHGLSFYSDLRQEIDQVLRNTK